MKKTAWWTLVERTLKAHRMSNLAAASRIGVNASYFTHWSNGKIPRADTAVKFAREFGVDPLEALVAIGLISQTEADRREVPADRTALLALSTDLDMARQILQASSEAVKEILREKVSDLPSMIDPEEYDLAASEDTRDEDLDSTP